MRVFKGLVLGIVAALGLAFPALAAERAIIVLDGSGSMWAQIEGKARITIARETLQSVLSTLPEELELGFMTYGHREKGNCGDIEMLVPAGAGTGAAIAAAAMDINPKGMTPISDAVRLAAEDLQFTEQKATVILITDGLETCEVDPCALADDLESRGIDFTTHVLGFGLSDEEGQQVACLAENTGGRYLPANDGAALVEALTVTVAEAAQAEPEPAPEPEPVAEFNLKPTASLSEGGPDLAEDDAYDISWHWYRPAADGGEGEWVGTDYHAGFEGTLEPGDYILKAEVGYASASQPITIVAGEVAEPHFVLDAAILKLHPRPSEGAEVDGEAAVDLRHEGVYVSTDYGDFDAVVPAGALEVDVRIGEAMVTRSYTAVAGETIEEDVVLGVGIARFTSEYVEGMPVAADIFLEIYEAKQALDGSRKSVSYGYGGAQDYELPAGDYVVAYRLSGTKGEIPFSVETAELTEVAVVLDAGILAVTVPGDAFVEVFGAAKDIEGNRTSFDYGYGPNYEVTLPAGDYVVVARLNDVPVETPVTVKGGERFELTVEAPPAGKTK